MKKKEFIIDFLASNKFPSIGIKTAEKIVDLLGLDCIELINNSDFPETLVQDEKLKNKITIIKKAINLDQYELLQKFCELEVSYSLAEKIVKPLNISEINKIFENPYMTYEILLSIKGINFITADSIALKLGVRENYLRVKFAVIHLAKENNAKGHHLFKKSELITNLTDFFKNSSFPIKREEIVSYLKQLKQAKWVIDGVNTGLAKFYEDHDLEIALAEEIINLKQRKPEDLEEDLNEYLQYQKSLGFILTNEQINAIKMVLENKISILIGSAGTGKSKTVSCLIEFLVESDKNVLCLAPTGKAAQRMDELLSKTEVNERVKPQTIHRFLNSNSQEYDCCIVDEFSMVTTELFLSLLLELKGQSKILLVGDKHQLPSIGAGNVLADLLHSQVIPITELTVPQRVFDHSKMSLFFDSVKRGKYDPKFINISKSNLELEKHIELDNEIIYLPSTKENLTLNVANLIYGLMPYSDIEKEVIVISPSNKNELGVDNLNLILRPVFNPYGYEINGTSFYVGDRVMQTKNLYQNRKLKVANGETGIITDADDESVYITWQNGEEMKFEIDNLPDIKHNYAITVHKAQGSEYQNVIVVLDKSHLFQHCRQLIYTAITRTKNRLIFVGDLNVLKYAINNNQPAVRYTELSYFLREEGAGLSDLQDVRMNM